MYIDCDLPETDDRDYADSDRVNRRQRRQQRQSRHIQQRRRKMGGDEEKHSGDDDGGDCGRKLLWAAYRDPGYRGGSIGEYQFYDWQSGAWDASTCQTRRCAKMDCHNVHSSKTHYQLVGVYKETDGLYDWAEQLFKHEGYCVWGSDQEDGSASRDGNGGGGNGGKSVYEFMASQNEKWVTSCTKMYLTDYDGNKLYLDIKPLSGGNITYGLYLDDHCSEAATMSFGEYVIRYYSTYYYNSDGGKQAAAGWEQTFSDYNYWMSSYKICQPCRAYSRVSSSSSSGSRDDREGRRFLDNNNNNNDGNGDEEQWGYNCYDDAGYTNCNQVCLHIYIEISG
jgi:hypothetical protein